MIKKTIIILIVSCIWFSCESEYYNSNYDCTTIGSYTYRYIGSNSSEKEIDAIYMQNIDNVNFYKIDEDLKKWILEYPKVRERYTNLGFGMLQIYNINYKEDYFRSHHSRASISFDSTSKGYSIRNIMIWNETKKNFDFVIIKN